jgi:hypothetical protein
MEAPAKIALFFTLLTELSSCKQRSADVLAEVSRTPPLVSYHFGSWKNLQQNADGISTETWQRYIASAKYVEFRRGLYVSQTPTFNERYAFESIGKSADDGPWLMRVILNGDKPECTRNFIGSVTTIDQNQDFADWISTNRLGYNSLEAFRSECLAGRATQAQQLAAFGNYETPETKCSQTVYQYMLSRQTVASEDYLWPEEGFWVLHRRECIKAVQVDPASVLDSIASAPDVWSKRPFGGKDRSATPKWKMASALYYVLLRALTESQILDAAVLDRISESASASDIDQWNVKGIVPLLMGSAKQCGASPLFRQLLRGYLGGTEVLQNAVTFNEQANALATSLSNLNCAGGNDPALTFDTRKNWPVILRESMRRAKNVTQALGDGKQLRCYLKTLFHQDAMQQMEPDETLDMNLRRQGSSYVGSNASAESAFTISANGNEVVRQIVLNKPLSASVTARIITGYVRMRMFTPSVLLAEVSNGILGGKVKAGQRPPDVPNYFPSVSEQGATLANWQSETPTIPISSVIIDPKTSVDPRNPVIFAKRYVATAYGVCKDPTGFQAEAFYDLLDQIKLKLLQNR